MWRWLTIATAIYGVGHPGLDAYRPLSFDRSLREFHRDVNRIAADAARVAGLPDPARTLNQLNSLSANLQVMLSGR